ncbi:MAG: prepilin-type N-terminal cleavage/methylation domain-containing protein [Pyrinomonadaceae bacterium]
MKSNPVRNNEAGFSLIELLVSMTVFLIVAGGAFALMGNAVRVSTTNFEMTDAQESLRFAQEYINRDLVIAGDGMEDVTGVRLPAAFVTKYLTSDQISLSGGFVTIEMMTPDNNVAAAFTTPSNPAGGTALPVVTGTDRLSMLSRDPDFAPIPVQASTGAPTVVNSPTMTAAAAGSPRITIKFFTAAEMNRFTVNEIYFFSSSDGKRRTFAAVTAKNTGGANNVTFSATGDPYSLNPSTVTDAPVQWISTGPGGTMTGFTISRMQIITYFVHAKTTGSVTSGLLTRRVIGVQGGGYRDSVVAEHVTNLQVRYQLNLRDASGNIRAPVGEFSAIADMITVRQVEVTVTAESTHLVHNNVRPTVSSTTATSIRNLQFHGAY